MPKNQYTITMITMIAIAGMSRETAATSTA